MLEGMIKLITTSSLELSVVLAGSVAKVGMITGSNGTITSPPSSPETFWNAGGMMGGSGGGGGRAGITDSPSTVALVIFSVEPVKTCKEY